MTEQMREATYTTIMIISLLIIMIGMMGCASNRYKIETKYINPVDEVEIVSVVEGKATIGRVASLYKNVLEFCNKQYISSKK